MIVSLHKPHITDSFNYDVLAAFEACICTFIVMCESRKVAFTRSSKIGSVQKSAPKEYFNLVTTILILTGMYPISSEHIFAVRSLHSVYSWCVYIFLIVLIPVSKVMALPHQTNFDDFAENLGLIISHTVAALKIGVFMIKRKDISRLVETMGGQIFRHKDCSHTFSANRLVCKAVQTSQLIHCFFLACLIGMMLISTFNTIMKRFEEVSGPNGTESTESTPHHYRALPFHGWFPFSTQISPNYELVFTYQIVALFYVGQMIFAFDTLIFSLMIHIKTQLEILSHNLRFIKSHAENRRTNLSASTAALSQRILDEAEDQLTESIEFDLAKNIKHHQAIIQLSRDLESVFTYPLLVQFICTLLTMCMQMFQISRYSVFSPSFISILPQLGGVTGQIFTYCWLGNEIMLQSSSVAKAAWDSGWCEISSRRYCYGVLMIIQRSQNVIVITAGGFAGLTLETFMTISQAAYSCFAVLKKMDV